MLDRGGVIIALGIAALGAVVLYEAMLVSSARFAASTGNEGNAWHAAEIDLDVVGESGRPAELFLDGENLLPGSVIENCVVMERQDAAVPLDVRLHGRTLADSPLAPLVAVAIAVDPDGGCQDQPGTDAAPAAVFEGSLADLLAKHGSYGSGLPLDVAGFETVALSFWAEVEADNAAQGLSAEYVINVEARP